VIQLGTYDGTVYNARQVVDKIGSLCDYILFDSAWVGYEQFIPMMADCSPLLLELNRRIRAFSSPSRCTNSRPVFRKRRRSIKKITTCADRRVLPA
jgi:hypothetical protein